MKESFPSLDSCARIVGVSYLIAMATSILGFVAAQLPLGSLAETAKHIIDNERFFRIGIASNLVTYIVDIFLIWGLYLILKPVNEGLALVAVFLRLMETACLSMGLVDEQITVRLVTHPAYSKLMESTQLYAFSRVSMAAYGASFNIGFTFLGLGSTIFSYLLYLSGYIPKALAALGIVSSLFVGLGTLLIFVFPEFGRIFPYGYGPMGVFEITTGFWLLIRGVKGATG